MQPSTQKTVRFGIACALLVGALYAVSGRNPPPPLPGDPDHTAARDNAACAACHGPAGSHPLAAGHPPKDDCRYCHPSG